MEKSYKRSIENKMTATKQDLCNRVAKKLGIVTIKDTKSVVETFLDEIITVLSEGNRIELRGFGCFSTKTRKAHVGRNPRTGKQVDVPEHQVLHFKFSNDAQNSFEEELKI